MGRNIGTLGVPREPLDLEFTYFDGVVIRVHPQASDSTEVEFLALVGDAQMEALEEVDLDEVDDGQAGPTVDVAVIRSVQALMDGLRSMIHPDDWRTYWEVGKKHGQQTRDRMADLKAITKAVMEATTDFPTRLSSGSTAGPAAMPGNSTAGSSSPATAASTADTVRAAAPVSGTDQALALLRGRPDLQEFILDAEEVQAARAREEMAGPMTAAQKLLAGRRAG